MGKLGFDKVAKIVHSVGKDNVIKNGSGKCGHSYGKKKLTFYISCHVQNLTKNKSQI